MRLAQPQEGEAAAFGGPSSDLPGLRLLQTRLQESEQQLQLLKSKTASSQRKVEALLQEIAAYQPPQKEKAPEPPQKKGYREVPYRLPLEDVSQKLETIVVVCEENRVSVVDIDAINGELKRRYPDGLIKIPMSGLLLVSTPKGDFDLKYAVTNQGVSKEYVRKADHPGQDWEEYSTEGSATRRFIESQDPDTCNIQFVVYPDSFDVFRQVRAKLWERSFESYWLPFSTGESFSTGAGKFQRD